MTEPPRRPLPQHTGKMKRTLPALRERPPKKPGARKAARAAALFAPPKMKG